MPRQAPEMKAPAGSIASANTRDRTRDQAQDQEYMARALQLAAQGQGLASPNPMVGAVLVRDARVVAEAFHTYDGLRHAEIIALEAAGENARGATLYINLEPCCHTGCTGPCTRALISAGIARVVAAMRDPNPRGADSRSCARREFAWMATRIPTPNRAPIRIPIWKRRAASTRRSPGGFASGAPWLRSKRR